MCARSETKLEKDLIYKRDSVGVDNLIYRKDNWLLRGINIEALHSGLVLNLTKISLITDGCCMKNEWTLSSVHPSVWSCSS